MHSSTRVGTRISSRFNKLAGQKVADRDTLQQLCSQPLTKKLMEWIDVVLQDETLMLEEYERYQEMKEGVIDDLEIDGETLLPSLKAEKVSLESEIAELEHELQQSEKREEYLGKQLSQLTEESYAISEVVDKTSVELKSDNVYKAQATAKVLQCRFEESLDNLKSTIDDYMSLYEDDKKCLALMSKLDLDGYVKSEKETTVCLGDYCRQLFFPGISGVPGDPRDCHLIGVEDEGKENTSLSSNQKAKDIVRIIKGSYRRRQEEKLNESLNVVGKTAQVNTLQKLINDVRNNQYPHSEASLTRMAEELSVHCTKKENDLKTKWEFEGVQMLDKLRSLQGVSLLVGNYNLKRERQNFFISRQDTVIKNLVMQLSRQELIQMILEQELKAHQSGYEILSNVSNHLQALLKSMEEQESLVVGPNAIHPLKEDRLCIIGCDKTLACVLEMLQPFLQKGNQNIFNTYDDLINALKLAIEKRDKSQIDARTSNDKIHEMIETVDGNIRRCGKCFETGFSTSTVQEDKLAQSISELEAIAKDLRDVYLEKCEAIKRNPDLEEYRSLFVKFFTSPHLLE